MKTLLAVTMRVSNIMSIIAGSILLIMMAITFLDIIMRIYGKPIVGAYELVAFMGAAVAAFALPRASLMKTHVYVDIVIDKLSGSARKSLKVLTRIIVFFMFLFAGWYFIIMARDLIATNTVTMTLRVPYFPVLFALSASCFAQSLISICEILSEGGETSE